MTLMTSSSTPISTSVSPSPSPDDPSPTSDTSTEDAYNTTEARIHFGPLKSPEKHIAATVARRNSLQPAVHSSPLRRSPRLSTPLPQSPLRKYRQNPLQEDTTGMNVIEEYEEVVDERMSRAVTPDVEEVLQDEPPSSLAIKISRAYDNPSPPPSPPIDLELTGVASPSPRVSLPPSSTVSPFGPTEGASNTEDIAPSMPSNGLPKNLSPILPTPSISRKTSPPDLISFESFSSPAPVFRAMSPSIPASQPFHSSGKPYEDDRALPLNHLSPPKASDAQEICTHIPPSENFHGEDKPREAEDIEDIVQDHHEEQSVLRLLSVSTEEGTHVKLQPLSASHSDDSMRTPILHSSRPRRSVSRYQDYGQLITRLPQHQWAPADKTYPQSTLDHLEESERRETEEHQPRSSPPKSTFFRELGSLSPTSNDLLSSLVTPSQQPLPFSLTIPPTKEASSSTQRPFPRSSPFPALPQTPHRSTSPIRFTNPSRSAARELNNTQLQAIPLDHPVCTPARRIPIEDAVAQGHISPVKGSQLLASSSRVGFDGLHRPLLTIPSIDSPARRVLALPEVTTPVVPKKWQGIRFGSPSRVSSKERFSSVEPAAPGAPKGKSQERGGSVPPSTGTSSSLSRPLASGPSSSRETSKPAKLPFPLVSSTKDISPTIPEECQAVIDSTTSPTKPSQATFSSPTKSTLKQTTSRIPTRTVKPYVKPHSKLDKGKSATRTGMPTADISKPGVISDRTLPIHQTDGKAKALPTIDKPEVLPTSLKRKRAVVELPSPVKPRPAVTLRQVPRVVVPNTASKLGARALPSITVPKEPQQIRRVIDKPQDVATNPPAKPILQTASSTSSSRIALHTQTGASEGIDEVKSDEKEVSVSEESSCETIPAPFEPIDQAAPPELVIPDGVRRTTRVRKVLNPSLVSDVLVHADAKPRRKPSAQTNVRGDMTYFGMSATALRALTTSNTVRNQRYLAAKLETEIVRKEGDRPESPAVKIKTVLQREQEEKKRQRKERAAKRARLSGESIGHLNNEDRHSDRETENESDWDDHSSPTPKRHKRGPGDEEEYKTPLRKLDRLKLVDDDDGREELVENERRVKWDRGLFTTISLDQVKLGTRRPPKENIVIKGCLAPAAKTLPLDNLGNLPYADAPLTDLIEENIVVKKFVYDNDVEAVEEVIVKNTRARSKKAKS